MTSKLFVAGLLALAGAFVVQGCGGGGKSRGFFSTVSPVTSGVTPVTSGVTPVQTATTPQTAAARFVYTSDAQSTAVSCFAINSSTGTLTFVAKSVAVGSSPVTPTGSGVYVLGGDEQGRFLYATNTESNDVAAFAIDATTGRLVKLTEWNMPARTPGRAALSPDGKWLVLQTFPSTGNNGGGWLMCLAIDPATGTLTHRNELAVGDIDNPRRFAFAPSSRFLYGVGSYSDTGQDDEKIEQFAFDSATGAITPVVKTANATQPRDIVFDASGAHAFVLGQDGGVETYSCDATTGSLTATSSLAGGGLGYSIGLSPDGKLAYVAGQTAQGLNTQDSLRVYSIDAKGALTVAAAPVDAGPQPGRVRIDPSGRFAFTADYLSDHVTTYTLDPTTGGVTATVQNSVCPNNPALGGPTAIWLVK